VSTPLRAVLIALALTTALLGWGTWYLTGRFKDVKEALERYG